jgi:undecaprenyl diphosphate synthase
MVASSPVPSKLPRHVAIIMDGNGRWARARGLPRIEGHRAGVLSVREIVRAAGDLGIQYLTLYAFSQENWQRPRAEVRALMHLLEYYLRHETSELNKNNVRLEAIGRLHDLPDRAQRALKRAKAALAKNTGLTLILALSYSGRTEIVDAVREIVAQAKSGHVDPEDVNEKLISQNLYSRAVPDPDMLIRTSGEMRVSNFMLWQMSYTELWITPTYWPDFRKPEFLRALDDFSKRERRLGKVGE